MFELLAQVHSMRGAMLSGPSCESGEFLPSDNWIGNNDATTSWQSKVCVLRCGGAGPRGHADGRMQSAGEEQSDSN